MNPTFHLKSHPYWDYYSLVKCNTPIDGFEQIPTTIGIGKISLLHSITGVKLYYYGEYSNGLLQGKGHIQTNNDGSFEEGTFFPVEIDTSVPHFLAPDAAKLFYTVGHRIALKGYGIKKRIYPAFNDGDDAPVSTIEERIGTFDDQSLQLNGVFKYGTTTFEGDFELNSPCLGTLTYGESGNYYVGQIRKWAWHGKVSLAVCVCVCVCGVFVCLSFFLSFLIFVSLCACRVCIISLRRGIVFFVILGSKGDRRG